MKAVRYAQKFQYQQNVARNLNNGLFLPMSNISGHISEWVLHECKKNNIIIFGLEETSEDEVQIKLLLSDLDIAINESDIQCNFRVGRPNPEKKQPVVVRLKESRTKEEILLRAKNLKGNTKWKNVVIAQDLTKREYLEEKARETSLRKEAEEKNVKLAELEKGVRIWKVVGGHERRHLALVPTCA